MGKNKKRKQKASHSSHSDRKGDNENHHHKDQKVGNKRDANPLLTAQQKFLKSLSPKIRDHFFSNAHVTPEERAEIWEKQADLGENVVNAYSWATPDPRLLPVFQHFGPIVEVGCGANAYWSKWMNAEGGVDVVALDVSLDEGGKISALDGTEMTKKSKKSKTGLIIRQGGPDTLAEDAELQDRTLFLCYPDEEDHQMDDCDEDGVPPLSMAAACLENYNGSTIIHVGELYGDTLSLEQAPFGRSSSNEFQQRLASEYHCILKMKLQSNWLHVKDTLSVWKRSETCCIAFENEDEDNEEDDEINYKYIPPSEVLPMDTAAPCVAHLLLEGKSGKSYKKDAKDVEMNDSESSSLESEQADMKQPKKNDWGSDDRAIAGNAW